MLPRRILGIFLVLNRGGGVLDGSSNDRGVVKTGPRSPKIHVQSWGGTCFSGRPCLVL